MRPRVGISEGYGTDPSTLGWRQALAAAAAAAAGDGDGDDDDGGDGEGNLSSPGTGPGIRATVTTAADASGSGQHTELAKDVWYRIEDAFSDLDGKTLALVLSCGALALLLLVGMVVVVVWSRRRRRKPFDLHHLDDGTEPVTVQSAPGSRSPSPKMPKRLSCPDALSHAKRGSPGNVVVRSSMTVGKIPDFTLPPERVQPRASGDRGGSGGCGGGGGGGGPGGGGGGGSNGSCTTALQYQQSLIGSLQPDLYSHSSSFSEDEDNYLPMSTYGRLWYSIVYDAAVEQLNVTLIKVKDLPGRGPHHHPRDPFVKVFLLPDDRVCRTSKVRKKTLSPVFNENFMFQVTSEDIKNRVLRFSVYDVDKKKVRHSLGHVMIPLRDVDLGHVDTYWSDLESMPQALSASLGDLELSLCYLPQTEKIKVGIMQARSLKHTDMDIDTRVYLRLQLFYGRKVHRTKRTGSRPGALDLVINESLSFSVSGKQLDSCRLEIALMMTSQRMLTHDVEYGRVVIGPFMYARGEELIHWQEIMAQPRSVVTRWHSLTASPSHD